MTEKGGGGNFIVRETTVASSRVDEDIVSQKNADVAA